METMNPQGVICQSCAMPMVRKEDFGTNQNGSQNMEYCRYCYQAGKFNDGGATLNEVIDKSVDAMRKMNMPESLIEQTRKFIPTLKRWKNTLS
jgi:cytochrome c2